MTVGQPILAAAAFQGGAPAESRRQPRLAATIGRPTSHKTKAIAVVLTNYWLTGAT